jgi:ABC-type transport system involved in cytochrome c biogenesis permease component
MPRPGFIRALIVDILGACSLFAVLVLPLFIPVIWGN